MPEEKQLKPKKGKCFCWNGVKSLCNVPRENYKRCGDCDRQIYPQRGTLNQIAAYHYDGMHFHADGCLINYLLKRIQELKDAIK